MAARANPANRMFPSAADRPDIGRPVREFAKSTGQLTKNDRLGAQILAHFDEAVRPPVRTLRDADTQALAALLARRRQLVTLVNCRENTRSRLEHPLGRCSPVPRPTDSLSTGTRG